MIEKIKAYNELHVTKQRNDHIKRVAQMGETLANIFKLSTLEQQQLEIACYLHDSTKDFSEKQLKQILQNEDESLLLFAPPIWHSFASAILGRDYFNISDPIIFEAVYYHTIGNAHLHIVSKLLFLADFIELGRTFPDALQAREFALKGDLNTALRIELESMRAHLEKSGHSLTTETEHFYKELERSI